MKVVKFGGSSVANASQIRKVAAIVAGDSERRIVVVSAPGRRRKSDTKVTDLLIAAARARIAGRPGTDETDAVKARFREITRGLRLPAAFGDEIEAELGDRVTAEIGNEGAYLDHVKATGEDLCARLVAEFLRRNGVDAHYVNPADAGMVLSGGPGEGRIVEGSYGRLRRLAENDDVVVFPGFYGVTEEGRTVTFPRGGSDITGAILAAATGADVYENFTDVDAVFAAHPGIVRKPRAIDQITYREMRELSYAGFGVFHDEALEPVFRAGIPVNVRNTNNPDHAGTMIVPVRDAKKTPVAGIAATTGFCTVYVSRYLMNREIGFGRRLLQIFEDEGVPFEHAPTGIDDMSVIVREDRFNHATEERVVRRLRTELAADEVRVQRGLALIMVVGEGMAREIGVAARACMAIAKAGINIEMINQGSSEVSMMFGVESRDVPEATRALYRSLIGTARRR